MARARRKRIDPLEQAIEAALNPGRFIPYKATWEFVEELRLVGKDVAVLIDTEPERAARLYEIFIAAGHEKAEEIDDSSGEFGSFVGALFTGWIKARQAGDANRDDTAKVLLAWMEDDPYGFCNDLGREAAKVLDRDGLDALTRRTREKLEAAAKPRVGGRQGAPGYASALWTGVLKALLAARRDIEAYVSLCEQTGLAPEDCRRIAELYRNRRRPAEALEWVERGLAIRPDTVFSSAGYDLKEMQRALLVKLGRREEALESAWAEFQEHPATFSYKELMRYVPANQKKAWHGKAMEASEKGDLDDQIDLWLETKELDRLVDRIRAAPDNELKAISHYRTEPLAHKLKRSHPDVAARVFQSLCMRIVDAGKSNYYYAALENLEHAKQCYAKAGRDTEWEALTADIRARHHRKTGFMPGFERIVSGRATRVEPTFLARARRRWAKQTKR